MKEGLILERQQWVVTWSKILDPPAQELNLVQMVTAAMKLKDADSLEGKLLPTSIA